MSAECSGYSWLCNARSNLVLAVENCSKGVFTISVGHGKSPWFSRLGFLRLVGVDERVHVLPFVDVGVFLECAF